VRLAGWALRVAVALAGASIGILLLGRTHAPIGPFDTTLAFQPVGGGAQLAIPPLGSLRVDAFEGPLQLDIRLQRIDQARAQTLVANPERLDGVVDRASGDLQEAVVELAWKTTAAGVLGAAVASLVVLRRWREPLIAAGVSAALLAGTAGMAASTWRPGALSQPTYTGLLVNANSLIGNAEDILARFDAYRASLEDLVGNVSRLYGRVRLRRAAGRGVRRRGGARHR
jgi:hypothetical protein